MRSLQRHPVAGLPALLLCQRSADHDLIQDIPVLFVEPLSFGHIPPGPHADHAGIQLFSRRKREMVIEPGSDHLGAASVRKRHVRVQEGSEVDDVKGPEDRLQLSEIILLQIGGVQFRLPLFQVIDVRQQGRILRLDRDVGAVGFQFLIDLVSDVHHDVQHACRQGRAQCDRECDQQHLPPLMKQHAAYHFEKHLFSDLLYRNSRSPARISASWNTRFPSRTS